MKIESTNQKHLKTQKQNLRQHPSFGLLKIAQGQVFKPGVIGRTSIDVDICLVQSEDAPILRSIYKKWRRASQYGKAMLRAFFQPPEGKQYEFFMVIPRKTQASAPKSGLLGKIKQLFAPKVNTVEPLCLAMLEKKANSFELSAIQSSSDILGKSQTDRISGSGHMAMYGISKYIRALGGEKLEIRSMNGGFCKRFFDCKQTGSSRYTITAESLDDFIVSTQKKFQLEDKSLSLSSDVIAQIKNN